MLVVAIAIIVAVFASRDGSSSRLLPPSAPPQPPKAPLPLTAPLLPSPLAPPAPPPSENPIVDGHMLFIISLAGAFALGVVALLCIKSVQDLLSLLCLRCWTRRTKSRVHAAAYEQRCGSSKRIDWSRASAPRSSGEEPPWEAGNDAEREPDHDGQPDHDDDDYYDEELQRQTSWRAPKPRKQGQEITMAVHANNVAQSRIRSVERRRSSSSSHQAVLAALRAGTWTSARTLRDHAPTYDAACAASMLALARRLADEGVAVSDEVLHEAQMLLHQDGQQDGDVDAAFGQLVAKYGPGAIRAQAAQAAPTRAYGRLRSPEQGRSKPPCLARDVTVTVSSTSSSASSRSASASSRRRPGRIAPVFFARSTPARQAAQAASAAPVAEVAAAPIAEAAAQIAEAAAPIAEAAAAPAPVAEVTTAAAEQPPPSPLVTPRLPLAMQEEAFPTPTTTGGTSPVDESGGIATAEPAAGGVAWVEQTTALELNPLHQLSGRTPSSSQTPTWSPFLVPTPAAPAALVAEELAAANGRIESLRRAMAHCEGRQLRRGFESLRLAHLRNSLEASISRRHRGKQIDASRRA